jgi:hypothetical protein
MFEGPIVLTSVADPYPYIFGPPGSGPLVPTMYGSGSGSRPRSFYHQAKIVRKSLILLFFDFFMTYGITSKNDANVALKRKKQRNLKKKVLR